MADTGIIRWPINFPPSSKAAILREARVGRITCQRVGVTPLTDNIRLEPTKWLPPAALPRLTFLKTIGSSSHTGLMALLFWEVLVFSAFLLVSAGSPNISTSTYTPTRRSVRNWPEITYNTQRHRNRQIQTRINTHMYCGIQFTLYIKFFTRIVSFVHKCKL